MRPWQVRAPVSLGSEDGAVPLMTEQDWWHSAAHPLQSSPLSLLIARFVTLQGCFLELESSKQT